MNSQNLAIVFGVNLVPFSVITANQGAAVSLVRRLVDSNKTIAGSVAAVKASAVPVEVCFKKANT